MPRAGAPADNARVEVKMDEAVLDLLEYLQAQPLDPDLGRALANEARRLMNWVRQVGDAALGPSIVLGGLRYLTPGPGPAVPSEDAALSDLEMVLGAPRFRALALLARYLLVEARWFDLSLLPGLGLLEDRLPGVAVTANRLAVLAAAADMPARARERRLPPSLVEEARGRVRELAFEAPAGVPYADLPDLAYDLRLVSFDHGAFSFSLQAFYSPVRACRTGDGDIVVLPEDGTAFGADGYLWNRACSEEPAYVAHVQRTGEAWDANCFIGDDGLCQRGTVSLGPPPPQAVLAPGDDALELHVQPGASLAQGSVEAAVASAASHYRRHFPDYSPRAVYMVSWLLDPQLAELLPAASRILSFQGRFRLYPCRYDAAYARDCVLGHISAARPLTTLQRAVLELEGRGGYLREGGGFILL